LEGLSLNTIAVYYTIGEIMKKFIPIVLVSILVLTGLGAAAFSPNVSLKQATDRIDVAASIGFSSQPVLYETDGFVEVQIDGATTQLIEPDKPVLPIYVRVFEIPFRSQNIQVDCSVQDISTMSTPKPVVPARVAPLSLMNDAVFENDELVYESAALYPDTWYKYHLSSGRNDNNIVVTFVKVVCYPVRYSPLNSEITYAGGFDIELSYTEPLPQPRTTMVDMDMVIIAPKSFESALQPLITHKESKGVATMFKSVEDILTEYEGYDQPEQIKYFIKEAYDTMNITYVLLVGGLKSHINAKDKDTISAGYSAWHVPVRYVSIPQGNDVGCLSDLYYGCLYNETGVFDSWDSNGDGVYAAWGKPGVPKDTFDMIPEVHVSRLPVSNKAQVKRMVKEIIAYESSGPQAKPWYNNFVGIGGKTFDYFAGKPDGEYLCDLAYDYIANINPQLNLVDVYSTNRDAGGWVPNKVGISKAMTQGASFVCFQGHGFPIGWDTVWHDGDYEEGDWIGGILLYEFWRISSGDKRAVVTVGGCHNGQYNVSIIPSMRDKKGTSYFTYGYPAPVCFSWGLMIKPRSAAIASTGCTGYGMGYVGNPVSLSGELESNFYWQIGMNGATTLGQAHSLAIQKFINENDILQVEAFCITNWAVFGDPSLVFGGYSS
jgi:hypothetical protein